MGASRSRHRLVFRIAFIRFGKGYPYVLCFSLDRPLKSARHHADDLILGSIQWEGAPQDLPVRVKVCAPETIAENGHVMMSFIFAVGEHASKDRTYAEDGEKIRAYPCGFNPEWLAKS